jgi:hypothetical protein
LREMGGYEGRWVAKLGRLVAKLVVRLLATAALWVRINSKDISQKAKLGDMSKGVAHTLKPEKKLLDQQMYFQMTRQEMTCQECSAGHNCLNGVLSPSEREIMQDEGMHCKKCRRTFFRIPS